MDGAESATDRTDWTQLRGVQATLTDETETCWSICCVNARSIRNKVSEVRFHLEHSRNIVYSLCETWLSDSLTNCDLAFHGYHVFRADRKFNGKSGGGVALLVPDSIQASVLGLPTSNLTFEAIAIKLHFKLTELVIISVYRAPSRSKAHDCFFDQWLDYFKSLNLKKVPFLIVGDFNFPNINWARSTAKGKSDSLAHKFLSFCLLNGLDQKVLVPTRIKNGKTKNILDLVLSSEQHLVSEIEVLPPFIESDHQQIRVTLGSFKSEHLSPQLRPDFVHANYAILESLLVSVPWESLFLSCSSVNEIFICFCSILSELINNPSLVPKIVVNSGHRKFIPRRIKHIAKEKCIIYKKYIAGGYKEVDKVAYQLKCKSYKLAVKALIRDKELAVLSAKKDKKLFAFIRSKQSCRPTIPVINDNGNLLLSDASKAECFSNYFASVFSRDNGAPPPDCSVPLDCKLSSCSFAPEVVYAALLDLPSKTSVGPDGIPPVFLRNLAVVLSFPLSLIFEKSFATGEVPMLWKEANVTPIYKKLAASLVSNYRPISLTSAVSKVFETILRNQITGFSQNFNMVSYQKSRP